MKVCTHLCLQCWGLKLPEGHDKARAQGTPCHIAAPSANYDTSGGLIHMRLRKCTRCAGANQNFRVHMAR